MQRFERAVLAAVRRHGLLGPSQRAVVAVSGGGDSTALLLVLDALARAGHGAWELLVAHLDHGWRGSESAADAAFVETLAHQLGRPCVVGRLGTPARGVNLEARARTERARFLEKAARDFGADAICLGHTRDDQAETVLMRLARGAGPASAAAMQPRRADGVVRPLLDRTRAECAAYVSARGFRARHDRSNDDERFFRSRIRRRVLPELSRALGVDFAARLARFAEDVAVESRLAGERLADLLPKGGERGLAVDAVRGLGPAGGRLVHAWLAAEGIRATHAQVEAVVRIACAERPSARVDLAGGRSVQRSYGRLDVAPRAPGRLEPVAPVEWHVPGRAAFGEWLLSAIVSASPRRQPACDLAAVDFDAAAIGAALTVRSPAPGDRIRLRGGSRKLSDVMVDRRVPRGLRARLAVVTRTDGTILWVPGVAVSTAASNRATSGAVATLSVENGLPEVGHRGKNPGISGVNCRARV